MGSVSATKPARVLSSSSAETLIMNSGKRRTEVDLKPAPEKKEPPEIKPISDAGVVCYAEWFGFTDKRLPEEKITQELREVVSYAYMVMRKQEAKEIEEKAAIPFPTWWQHKLAGQSDLLKTLLRGHSEYFKPDIDGGDLRKREHRQLRDGLEIDRKTSSSDVYKVILQKIKIQS